MTRRVYCLDTSVLVKTLVPEEGSNEASLLLRDAITDGYRLVAPAFAWAEVGTTLRKKARTGLITKPEADTAWKRYLSLEIEYLHHPDIPEIAWNLSSKMNLPTLYDASFLAVCETVLKESRDIIEFWTSDQVLVASLGNAAPKYVRLLTASPSE